MWQQLELLSEPETDLRGTADWDLKSLGFFNSGKTQLASFDRSNNSGTIDAKMFLRKKNHTLRCWECLFLIN